MSDNPRRSRQRVIEHARRKADRAVFLRTAARMTYAQIAEQLLPCPAHEPQGSPDCELCERLYANAGTARRAIIKALEAERHESSEMRKAAKAEHLATIDVLLSKAITDARTSTRPADRARAMTAAARLLDQKARLQGLYAPTQLQITDELDEQIRAELEALAETPLPDEQTLRE